MPTNVIMPALGMAQDTGKVLRWLKRAGEAVTQGEPLLEVETDKATVELEAGATGVLAQISASDGESVPVGQVIAVILAPDEAAAGPATVPAPPPAAPPAPGAPPAVPVAPPVPAPPAARSGPGRVPASPRARRLARERGVDLAAVAGSGPSGAVLAADLTPAAGAVTPGTVWRLMAERTTRTWTSVPHFFLMREVHAGRLIAWRESHRRRAGPEITYTDLLVRVVAAALRAHPQVNARWEDGTVVRAEAVNIGLAVAVDDGLVVPVVRGADRLSVGEIAQRRIELVARAREGRLRPDDLTGGTFTISNLGMYGVDAFTAVLNAPQAAILAVGRIADRVVPVEGQAAVRPMLVLSLSCDHRVIDGARGARFLERLADLIEEPAGLVE